MALITSTDFNKIITEHGEDAKLIQVDEIPAPTNVSAFDMIYGFADPSGEAGSGSVEVPRLFKCLIQEVINGQENWISQVGALNIGDAVMFCKPSYTDATGAFSIKSTDIIESVVRANQRYDVEEPANNLDGEDNIFVQVILRKKQT